MAGAREAAATEAGGVGEKIEGGEVKEDSQDGATVSITK